MRRPVFFEVWVGHAARGPLPSRPASDSSALRSASNEKLSRSSAASASSDARWRPIGRSRTQDGKGSGVGPWSFWHSSMPRDSRRSASRQSDSCPFTGVVPTSLSPANPCMAFPFRPRSVRPASPGGSTRRGRDLGRRARFVRVGRSPRGSAGSAGTAVRQAQRLRRRTPPRPGQAEPGTQGPPRPCGDLRRGWVSTPASRAPRHAA